MDGYAERDGRAAGDRLLAGDRLRRRGEAEVIDSLCDLATIYRLDEDELNEALVERRIRLGAAGTPTVSEYLSLEVAGLLGCTATAAASRLADALNLKYRHPRLYQAVQEMDIDAGRALKAAARCTGLHPIHTDAVTTAWLARQKGKGWTAAFNALDKLITESDVELAAEKERRARQDRGVHAWGAQDGVMNLTGRLDITDARLVDDRLSLFADLIEPEFPALTHSQRRAKAMGVLTDPHYAVALLEAAGQPELPGTTACHCGCHHANTDTDTPPCTTRPAEDTPVPTDITLDQPADPQAGLCPHPPGTGPPSTWPYTSTPTRQAKPPASHASNGPGTSPPLC
ncbi:DUF222 domain-containing protein [Tessaracoccus sp. HDW20]|uniref:DUF222 domain-containing protein n=1 Tax=Tessaracoccus coleopterorum TaxID=2714950 RepID=UPI0018D30A91|nr:DUF222 domain-containing protein [Tessaracoccus coleopterorum]NHB85058.1 DUF222 domain-containing protein [Tessaracoccus coleopterorum]